MAVLHVAAGNLYGGVERILVEIARAAAPGAHEFALSFEGRLSRELASGGATPHQIGEVRFSRPLTTWRARRRLASLCRSGAYEAVICHSPWSYALAAPVLVPSRAVLWAHDAMAGTHWTERRVVSRPPALVICNSAFTEAAVATWLPDRPREVIYAPVSRRAARRSREEVRASLGATASTTVIIIAARFERWKGHELLLRAAAGLPGEWAIWIAGGVQRPHERAYLDELRALAATGGSDVRATFLGEREDVPDLLHAADILCQPNTAPEPFGLTFIEAMHAGLPVVTVDGGGAREVVSADCGVRLPAAGVEPLRAILDELIADPARRRRLGEAGRARARVLCDPVLQLRRLEAVLRAMCPEVAA